MALLLTYEQQKNIKPISENNKKKYSQLAKEVESLEIDKLLGSAFYQAVSESPADYTELLDETEFENSQGQTIKHRGLRYVIAYLNYAKYAGGSSFIDTATGFKKKSISESELLSTGEIKRLQQENREIAFNAFSLIREYLNLNRKAYPLWGRNSDKKTCKPKFYGIKKTIL